MLLGGRLLCGMQGLECLVITSQGHIYGHYSDVQLLQMEEGPLRTNIRVFYHGLIIGIFLILFQTMQHEEQFPIRLLFDSENLLASKESF